MEGFKVPSTGTREAEEEPVAVSPSLILVVLSKLREPIVPTMYEEHDLHWADQQ